MESIDALYRKWLPAKRHALIADIGLLLIRLQISFYMIYGHGWKKLADFNTLADSFPDPLGIGSRLSLTLAVLAEFFASVLLAFGLATRFAAFLLISTMVVAGLIVHADDPFRVKELALVFLAVYIGLLFTGPGRFSLDRLLFGRPHQQHHGVR